MSEFCRAISKPIEGLPDRPCNKLARENGLCWQHSPKPGRKPGKKKGDASERGGFLHGAQRALLYEDCYIAVRKIAAGHGDAMELCKNLLKRFAWSEVGDEIHNDQ